MAHTPGPWRFSESQIEGECIIKAHELPILARTHNWPDNYKDNARLIAAAPDLLEACEHFLEALRLDLELFPGQPCEAQKGSVFDLTQKAIAKAKGES